MWTLLKVNLDDCFLSTGSSLRDDCIHFLENEGTSQNILVLIKSLSDSTVQTTSVLQLSMMARRDFCAADHT
jgi:hypothetical protein